MKNRRLKIALLSFLGISSIGLLSGILYLQSASFADFVKHAISERSPEHLGVVGDFSNIKLYFFPPGIGIANPKLTVSKENVAKIPLQANIEAKELRVSFAPIQMFSGVLQVSEVAVKGGAVQGKLFSEVFKPKPEPAKKHKLSWHDLFQLQVNGFRLEDTYLNLTIEAPNEKKEELATELVVKSLTLQKERINGHDGLISSAVVDAVRLTLPDTWKQLPIREANQLQWNVQFTDEGLKLDPFVADLSGIRLKLSGDITGNLLDEKGDPSLQARLEATSDLGTFFLTNLNDDRWNGSLEVKSQVSAKLKDVAKTLKGDFTISGKEVEWKKVKTSRLLGEGSIDLKDQKLSLKSLEVFDDNPASGEGKVRISSHNIPLQFNEPFKATIEIANSDLHWLGGIVPRQICPLEANVSGRIEAGFTPGKKNWSLKADTDLNVLHFALTNQKLDEPRKKKFILRPPGSFTISGQTEVTPQGIDFHAMKVNAGKTALVLNGGVHGSAGFDLFAKGPVDLKDINEIAENEVRGAGDLELKVHGPAAAVLLDFDAKLKNSSYLGMNFGDMSGRITYDDDLSQVRFTRMQGQQGETRYSLAEGFIDLSGKDDLHFPIEVQTGRIENIAYVLDSLLKKISWYPKTLTGEVHGKVDIGGKIDTPKMIISTNLEGSDWSWMGERARKVKMNFGYNQGIYYAKNVALFKTQGYIRGNIDFSQSTDEMNWNFYTQDLSLNDIDFLDRLEIPAKSKIEFSSQGSGKLDHLKSRSEGKVYDTEIKGEAFESSHFSLDVGENTMRANVSLFGNKLSSQFKYALVPKQPSSFRIDLNDFDFSPVLLILNPRLLDDPDLVGQANAHVQLDFLSTQSELARGEIQIKSYELKKNGFSLELADPINVPVQLGYFHFPPSRLRFKNSELVMSGEGKRGDIDFRLTGQADMAIAEFFSSTIQSVAGKMDADFHIKGPVKEPMVNGDVDFAGAKVQMRFLQTPFEEVDGSIRFRQGVITVENMESYLGDEVFTMNGKIQTYTDRLPELDLRAQLEDNKVKMLPLDLVQARGTVFIRGPAPPYTISGNLDVPQALWTKSFSSGNNGGGSRGDRFLPKDKEKQNGNSLFNLDLNVTANQGFVVRNEIIDAEFKGKVHMTGAPDNPRMLGDGQLVQGKILFKDRPFIFESVKVEFDDPNQLNPKFSASALADVNPYKIRLLAYGRASSWKPEFSSTPFLPESEIFSLLASGYTAASEASRYKTRDRSLVSQGEAASLILHSMDFSKDVQSRTGLQFDVEEAVDSQYANSVFRPQNLSDNMASPKLVIKRQLGKNLVLGVGSTVGVGSENQKEVNMEYKLTPGASALGVWNNIEEMDTRETRTSFGLDLKFHRRFK